MIKAPVHHQFHYFSLPEDQPHINLKLQEQECISLLKICNNMKDLKQAHALVLKLGLFSNPFCASNLLSTCALSGSMNYAYSIFRQIEEPGSFEFNTMIRGYVQETNFEKSLLLYHEMLEKDVEPDKFTYPVLLKACAWLKALEEGIQLHGHVIKLSLDSDVFVQNGLVSMYGKCEEIELSCAVFEKIGSKSVASWSAIIAAHANLGLWMECLVLFREMKKIKSLKPEESTLVNVISASANLNSICLGKSTHGYLVRNITQLNSIVQTSLVDMYAKCGCLSEALLIFQKMKTKNILSYSAVISGLGKHGQGKEALRVFSEMLDGGLQPDEGVYVSLLSACSHTGLVKEGLQLFQKMKDEHEIEPTVQHYSCLVDLMGRAGKLDEAFKVIKTMPMQPNDVVWRSLLSSCRVHHNTQLGEVAARNLLGSKTSKPSDYLVMSSIYARAKKWENVGPLRAEMCDKGFEVIPGFSLVQIQRKIYKFVSQDRSHPRHEEIYEMIHQIEWQIKFEGYAADTSQVLVDVGEQEKIERLRGHSQKLAIAFALISTSPTCSIRIARNLRMCSDCHSYTKLISLVYGREIVVKDRNRFHHFRDGNCSCGDYW